MSNLTKLFVVLLIVCSLLLSAATVVFVNRTEDWRLLVDKQKQRMSQLENEKRTAAEQAMAAQNREAQAVDEANKSVAKLKGDLVAREQEAARAQASVNQKQTELNVAQAAMLQATTALKMTQDNLTAQQKRNEALVSEADKLRGLNFDLTGSNTDLTKRLEEAERERRWLAEQVAQLKTDLGRAKNLLVDHRIPFDGAKPVLPQADVKGVIKEVVSRDGQTFATISIGLADKVQKGMEFNVINQKTAEFLGKFTVDVVEQNEAFGRLEGPRVGEVKPDYQVLSQL